VDLSGLPDYQAYLTSLSRNMRHEISRRKRKLEGAGEVHFELVHGGPEARKMVADAMDLKRTWLVRRGAMSSAFIDPATRACLLDLAADSATGSAVARLTVDGATAAIRFGFEYQGTHFTYLGAYDERFGEFSPGTLLMDFLLAGFKERALLRLDMLPPAAQHKREWCPSQVCVADYALPLTELGRTYAAVYQERIRPGLQWTWQHMPASLRSLLALLLVRL
jgi:CelD/BcsL family acetyltransferase involved in cellulose biosynthesis